MDDLQTIRLGVEALHEARPEGAKGGEPQPGETTVAWWPYYDKRVFEALHAAHSRVVGPDYDYMRNMESLSEAPIASASMSDLSTWFTYLMRGDHFNDGFLLSYIENGMLLQMFERLEELLSSQSS